MQVGTWKTVPSRVVIPSSTNFLAAAGLETSKNYMAAHSCRIAHQLLVLLPNSTDFCKKVDGFALVTTSDLHTANGLIYMHYI